MLIPNANLLTMKHIIHSFLIFINIINFDLHAQGDLTSNLTELDMIQNLKNGVLVIRLKSEQKKINYLENQLKNNALKQKEQTRIKNALHHCITERDSVNNSIIAAFGEYYNYSKTAFVYDADIVEWKKNPNDRSRIITSNIKETESMPQRYVQLVHGITENNGLDAFIFTKLDNSPFGKSYPQYIKFNSFKFVWNTIIGNKERYKINAIRIAQTTQRKLEYYW